MRTFEVLFILSPQLVETDSTNLISEFRSIAEKNGAKVVSEDAWGRRRLAYPIEKMNEGIYHLFVFHSENDLHELDRRMKNSDQVVRHLIVRTDLEQKRATKLALKRPKKPRVTQNTAATAAAQASAVVDAAVADVLAPAPEAPAAE